MRAHFNGMVPWAPGSEIVECRTLEGETIDLHNETTVCALRVALDLSTSIEIHFLRDEGQLLILLFRGVVEFEFRLSPLGDISRPLREVETLYSIEYSDDNPEVLPSFEVETIFGAIGFRCAEVELVKK